MIHFPFLSATVLSKQWLDWCPLEFPLHWCKTQPLLTQREFHSFSSLMAVWSFGKPTQMIPEKFLTIFTIPMSGPMHCWSYPLALPISVKMKGKFWGRKLENEGRVRYIIAYRNSKKMEKTKWDFKIRLKPFHSKII